MQIEFFRLKDVKEKVDLKEVIQPRYKHNDVYVRIKNGVMVVVGSSQLTFEAIMILVGAFVDKMRQQKKKIPQKTNVFYYTA